MPTKPKSGRYDSLGHWHCPFCDATHRQIEDSIRAYGFFGTKFCDYCGLRQASLPLTHPPPRSRR